LHNTQAAGGYPHENHHHAHTFSIGEDVRRTDQLLIKNLKTNKVLQIAQEIGQRPDRPGDRPATGAELWQLQRRHQHAQLCDRQ